MISSENFIQQTDSFLFNNLKCLRFETSLNHCTLCSTICPEEAFEFNALRMILNEKKCTSCSVCIGSCPSEALFLKEFDENSFANNYSNRENIPLSCQTKEIPCLAVFDPKNFVTMAINNLTFSCDCSECSSCEKNIHGKTYTFIKESINDANTFLEKISSDKKILEIKNYTPLKRRELFKRATEKLKKKEEREKKRESLKNRNLLKTLQTVPLPESIEFNKLIFSKTVNKSCNLCNECQDFCPTGALEIVQEIDKTSLYLKTDRCINCGNCELICKQKAITKASTIDLTAYKDEKELLLATGEKKICQECRCTFITSNESSLCDRCQQIENLPNDLFSLARDLD